MLRSKQTRTVNPQTQTLKVVSKTQSFAGKDSGARGLLDDGRFHCQCLGALSEGLGSRVSCRDMDIDLCAQKAQLHTCMCI